MDQEIPIKCPNEFLDINVLTDLNDILCLSKEYSMFDQEFLNNYITCILDAKYKQVKIANTKSISWLLSTNVRPLSCHLMTG